MTPAEKMQDAFLNRPRLMAFHEQVVASIPCVPDDDETRAALRAKRVDYVLGIYLNYASRFVPARQRQVAYATDFWTERALSFGGEIAAIEGKIRRGEDLTLHLSPNILGNGFTIYKRRRWEPMRDLALNAFGIHHLHTKVDGTNDLVFIDFDENRALFVMFGHHKSFDDGSLADAVARTQAENGWDIKGALGSANPRTPKEQMTLARHGIGSFGNANGTLTMGAMLMSHGDGLRVGRMADIIIGQILALDPMIDDRAKLDEIMPGAQGKWTEQIDFVWLMQNTGLVLFERNAQLKHSVTRPVC